TRRPVPAPSLFAGLGERGTVVQADPADLSSLRRGRAWRSVSGIGDPPPPAPGPPGARAAVGPPTASPRLPPLGAAAPRGGAAAAGWGVRRVALAGALGVYEGVPDTPYGEDAHLRQLPVDPIPAAKNAAELLAAIVTQSAGPQVVNLRIATIWGPGNTSRAP